MLRRLRSLFAGAPPAPPFRYPEGRHGQGELAYVGAVPVLRVAGSPEEVAGQIAALALRPAPLLLDYPEGLLRTFVRSRLLARLLLRRAVRIGERMLAQFPEAPRRELEALVAAGLDRGRVVAANTLWDLKNITLRGLFGCSSLLVPAAASATGAPLFGRNLDFFALGYLHRYSLVIVHPAAPGRRAFASVGFPGVLGCFSGINDAGLALSSHEVYGPPGPRTFDPRGVPFTLAYRRVLEECATTAEALALLRATSRATSTILALCDPAGPAVLELTPDRVEARPAGADVLACTNHFLSPALARRRAPRQFRTGERLRQLEALAGRGRLAIADVHAALSAVHQRELTIQTMIFEPAARRAHLGLGAAPSTEAPLQALDLTPLFGG
jgi:isopenicillin-N N-acyltransferase-like protein